LRISCYCDACLNSSDLRVGVTTLLNTIQYNAMLLRCNCCRNLAAVNCILHWTVLTISSLHIRNSSCITLLWLHHNHKISISYHKNRLV